MPMRMRCACAALHHASGSSRQRSRNFFMACGFIRKRRYELFVRWKHIRRISCENRAAAHPGRGDMFGPRGIPCGGGYMFGPVASPCGARVPAWTLCSGGAGRISVRVAAVSGRAGRIPRTQGLPSSRAAPSGRGPMLRFRTLFVLFCSVPPRRNRRRLQIRGFAAREKRKSCFFIFTL